MADSRYRNGVYVGSRHRQELVRQERDSQARLNDPICQGWTYSHTNTEHSLPVYTQAGMSLMADPDEQGWLVEDEQGVWLVQGPDLQTITANLLAEREVAQ